MKCVGHFGSARAGGTLSNCSLKAKCDRAALPSPPDRFDSPKQSGAGVREPEWRTSEREKQGGMGAGEGGGGEGALQRGNTPADIIRIGREAV